jgi:hypothetical protein
MADYQCHPLWHEDWDPARDASGPMIEDMASLNLDASLVDRLDAWARRFDTSLNWDDPGGPSHWNNQQWLDFFREGAELTREVEVCLSGCFAVRYHHADELRQFEDLVAGDESGSVS